MRVAAGWLLLFFTTVAVSVPFGMILQFGIRFILVAFYGEDGIKDLPWWVQPIFQVVGMASNGASPHKSLAGKASM